MLSNTGTVVVTTGQSWADIDAYACVTAYTELLNLLEFSAVGVIPGALNATIPNSFKHLGNTQSIPPKTYNSVVIVDVSNPEFFASFVDENKIQEIFDHHSGFETLWNNRLKEHSHIENIGAAATLIWEEIERANMADRISTSSAKLVAAAIASNTLNFQIKITSKRDRDAFHSAAKIGGFDVKAQEEYFAACEQNIRGNIEEALKNDTKCVHFPKLNNTITIGQVELWHSEPVLKEFENAIKSTLGTPSDSWILNAPSIGDGYTLMYCTNKHLQNILSHVLPFTWKDSIGRMNQLILRKEIIKALEGYDGNS